MRNVECLTESIRLARFLPSHANERIRRDLFTHSTKQFGKKPSRTMPPIQTTHKKQKGARRNKNKQAPDQTLAIMYIR